jgi:hypothetical protein
VGGFVGGLEGGLEGGFVGGFEGGGFEPTEIFTLADPLPDHPSVKNI